MLGLLPSDGSHYDANHIISAAMTDASVMHSDRPMKMRADGATLV